MDRDNKEHVVDVSFMDLDQLVEALRSIIEVGRAENAKANWLKEQAEQQLAAAKGVNKELERQLVGCWKARDKLQAELRQTEAEAAVMRAVVGVIGVRKLRWLADWFDIYDARTGNKGHDEIQRDLRQWVDALETALSGTAGAKMLAVVKAAINYEEFLQSKLLDEASPWQELGDAIKAYKEAGRAE